MKIASFNINNINRRLTNLLNWLREAEPDIVCLQELKDADVEFPAEAIRQAGYHAVFRGERRWNGVAILARWAPVVTRMDLPGDTPDGQCRYLEAAVNGVLVASIYAPNGNPRPGPKFDYKLAWLKRLNAHADELYATGAPVVLAGDYNVVPTDLDIYSTKSWDRNALLQPESRAAYQRLLAEGSDKIGQDIQLLDQIIIELSPALISGKHFVAFRRRLQDIPADDDRAGPLVHVEAQQEVREAEDGARSLAVAATNGFRQCVV